MTTEMAVHEGSQALDHLSIEQVTGQVALIQQVMTQVMNEEQHYGTIPGTDKPALYKAGAEKLSLTFKLAATFPPERRELIWHDDGHLTVVSTCVLVHKVTGALNGEGEGICSTKESKYAYRYSARKCPTCGVEAIVKRKKEKGGGWICIGKDKGGCWSKFEANDPQITDQETGRVANPDLPDQYNTVIKMAEKRALVAAVLVATAASDIFTQDVEDAVAAVAETEATPHSSDRVAIPPEKWVKSLRTRFPDDAIVAAAESVRARVGKGEEITDIDGVLAAKSAESQAAIEKELESQTESGDGPSAPAAPPKSEPEPAAEKGTPDDPAAPSDAAAPPEGSPPGDGGNDRRDELFSVIDGAVAANFKRLTEAKVMVAAKPLAVLHGFKIEDWDDLRSAPASYLDELVKKLKLEVAAS